MAKAEANQSGRRGRVVVDELFDNGTARLLVAIQKPDRREDELGMNCWEDEQELLIDSWRVECFVGFPSDRKLQEGDVFLLRDADRLIPKYKPIPREVARKEHLLVDWESSTSAARKEIKHEFTRLAMSRATRDSRSREELLSLIQEQFVRSSRGGA